MENRKQSVRLLMQKERERREQLRRQAAVLATNPVQQHQQRQQDSDGAPSSVAHEGEGLKTDAPSPPSLSQPFFKAASTAATGSCASVRLELPPDFFDAAGCTSHATVVAEPQSDVEIVASSNGAAGGAEVTVAAERVAAGAVKSPAADSEAAGEPEALTEEEEEGVVFEIEEPDSSLLLPRHLQSSSHLADVVFLHDGEEATRETRNNRTETAGVPLPAEATTAQFNSQAAAARAAVSEEVAETARRAAAKSGGRRREKTPQREPVSSPSVPPAGVPAVTPSPVTAALLASATGDELRWYRPFDTVFHSELLHEEEELAELQREAQVAAEKRAAAAREAASAAAAAAARDKGASKKDEAAVVSGLTKHQLAKRRAAAEATAAAAAAAEAAATAAVAAAEKHAAASEALLGKAQAAGAARAAEQRQHMARDVAVPWGFFDDEEREAAARGLTGPRRLQELLQRAEERRRDMAEDLQERKMDWLRHREDVRRFVHGVEEQLQDNSAYRLRVERLKQKRKAAAAGFEWSSSVEMAAPTAAESTTVPTDGAAAAAGVAKASQEAALTVEADTCRRAVAREAGRPDAAGTAVKQDLDKGPKMKKEDLPGSVSEDIRGPSCGDSHSRHDDIDNRVESIRTSDQHETAESRVKSVLPDVDVGLQVRTHDELLTGHLARAAPTVGIQALQTEQETLQQGRVEHSGSVQAYTSPREDYHSGSPGEEAEVYTSDEDDDRCWRAKSLLTHSPVPNVSTIAPRTTYM